MRCGTSVTLITVLRNLRVLALYEAPKEYYSFVLLFVPKTIQAPFQVQYGVLYFDVIFLFTTPIRSFIFRLGHFPVCLMVSAVITVG